MPPAPSTGNVEDLASNSAAQPVASMNGTSGFHAGGSIIYFSLFIVFRLLRRRAGAFGISDLVVVVLIADATQNALSTDYKSITEGLILVATLAFWDHAFDWLDYRFPSLRPLLLVKDGHILRRNLRKEMITEDELMEKLRETGHDKLRHHRPDRPDDCRA
jgi:uncharacterized membrane protein YcaP (DUF421 family)